MQMTFRRRPILGSCFRSCRLAVAAAFCLGSSSARAGVLFEGYSKVLLGGAHVGFVVERYELDEKNKEFVASYLLKTDAASGSVTESLKARSNLSMEPISYSYTSLAGKTAESIDATFSPGGKMTMKVRKGNSVVSKTQTIKKGVFLSRFLIYLMLQSKEGIKTGSKYSYQAIAEEDGQVYPGEAIVQGRETVAGESVFKVVSKFKGSQFTGYVNASGEVLLNRSPSLSLSSELVADRRAATKGHEVSDQTLKMIFGAVPEGKENAIARRAAANAEGEKAAAAPLAAGDDPSPPEKNPIEALESAKRRRFEAPKAIDPTVDTPKKSGVPPGKGLILKPGSNGGADAPRGE